MTKPIPRALANLERIKDNYGGANKVRKLALLHALDRARLRTAGQVEREYRQNKRHIAEITEVLNGHSSWVFCPNGMCCGHV